jgi:hypothetical protein
LGGDSGQPAIVRGEPDKSLIIQSIRHDDADKAMPPKKPDAGTARKAHGAARAAKGSP